MKNLYKRKTSVAISLWILLLLLSGCGAKAAQSISEESGDMDSEKTILGEVIEVTGTGIMIAVGTKREPADKKNITDQSVQDNKNEQTIKESDLHSTPVPESTSITEHTDIEQTNTVNLTDDTPSDIDNIQDNNIKENDRRENSPDSKNDDSDLPALELTGEELLIEYSDTISVYSKTNSDQKEINFSDIQTGSIISIQYSEDGNDILSITIINTALTDIHEETSDTTKKNSKKINNNVL